MAMYKHPKGIAFTLLLLTLLSVLTGCLRSGVDITVNDDDTGQVEVSFGISRDYYQLILSEYGTEPYEGKATTEITDGDTTYICVSETKKFQTLDELKDILLSLEYTSEETESMFSSMESDEASDSEEAEKTDTHIFKTADVSKEDLFFSQSYTLHLVTNAMESGGSEDELFSIPTDSVFRVLLNITLPGTIHAEGAVIHDNTASYTITDLENENVIHVESCQTDTVRIVAVIVAVVCTVALIGIPALLGQQNRKTEIVRVKTDIECGTVILAEQLETVEVSTLNLPADVAVSADQVVGKFALVDMVAGDYFLPSKVSSTSPVKDTILSELSDGKVAVSMSLSSFAGALSNKLATGDIVGIYKYEDGVVPVPELQYIKIIALTNSNGVNIEDATGDESAMASTVTFLATYAQAEKIIQIENESPMHIVLVSRDDAKRAKSLLDEQKMILEEIAAES